MNTQQILLANVITDLEKLMAGLGAGEAAPVDPDAPFGRDSLGAPRMAPAYDACRAMWEHAQREGVFSMWTYTGQGIMQGAAQMYSQFVPNVQNIENALVALGNSRWGQEWLAHPENAAMVGRDYQIKFLGCYYTLTNQQDPSQGYTKHLS